jgi:hypothetical protein
MSLSDQRYAAHTIRLSASFPATVQSARTNEPFTVGVPLPRGGYAESQVWAILGNDGGLRPAQTRALDRWSDGSVRWLLVDGNVDLSSGSCDVGLVPATRESPPAARASVTATQSQEGVWIDTGAARFHLQPGRAFPFTEVVVRDAAALDRDASGLLVEDEHGARCATAIDSVSVEEEGSHRVSVLVRGSVRRGHDEFLALEMRAHFFAGLPTVRLLVTLTNRRSATHPGGFWDLGDPGSVFVRDASLSLALAAGGEPTVISCSPEEGARWESPLSSVEVYQDSSGGENWQSRSHVNRHGVVPTAFRGYRMTANGDTRAGHRGTPIVVMDSGPRRVAAALPAFWQNFPKSIEASGGTLTIRLFPRQYGDVHEIQGGEQKTTECFVSFGADGVTVDPLEWCRVRPLWHADPAWCLATGAIPFLSEVDPRHGALIRTAVEGADTFERKREVVDEYGWRHFGDVYGDHEAVRHQGPMPLVSHYNNQYDTIAGFLYQFTRSGDYRWGALMADLAAHVVNIDIYHTTRDRSAYNQGLFWHTYHYGDAGTSTHRTYPRADRGRTGGGGPSADHNYTTGLMLCYFLTGNRAFRDTAINSAEYVLNIDDGRQTVLRWLSTAATGGATASADGGAYHGPGRGPANSLNALIDGHRLSGDPRFLTKAEQLIRRVIHPEEDIADRHLDEPERRWFYTMFLQSLGKYLDYKEERGELDGMHAYARASLLHYARWMALNEYPYLEKPERLEFPTETWGAQEIRKSDAFYLAALHSPADERARLIERGAFFFRTAVETLERSTTRTLARPVIVMLSSGLLHSWIQSHPAARAADSVVVESFGEPERFVTQRQQAKQRLVWLGVAGVLACVLLAGAAIAFFTHM